MKSYESVLPAAYRDAFIIDFKDRHYTAVTNSAAIAVTLLGICVSYIFSAQALNSDSNAGIPTVLFLIAIAAYLFVHELVHGAAYFMLTHHKITFCFTGAVAYCGVPDVYIYRTTALIALAAPLVLLSLIFLSASALFLNGWLRFYSMVMFWLNLGGCVSDIYTIFLCLTRFREPTVLLRNTGTVQTIYVCRHAAFI